MLPDFLSSRYSGELAEFESVCVAAESEDSLSFCNAVRPVENAVSISARSAARWVGRRVALFAVVLRALLGVAVEQVQGVHTATQLREHLECDAALVALRANRCGKPRLASAASRIRPLAKSAENYADRGPTRDGA